MFKCPNDECSKYLNPSSFDHLSIRHLDIDSDFGFRVCLFEEVSVMKILDRYVLFSFLKNYLISLMVLLGLYIVLDMVFNFDQLVDVHGVNTAQGLAGAVQIMHGIVDYYFYQSFLIYAHLSGIIPVVAVAFTLIRLSRFNELSAILAAGVPLLRVSAPIIFAAMVLNVVLFVDQEAVIPRMIPQLTRQHSDVQTGASAYARGFQIQAMQDSDRSLLMSSRFTPGGPDGQARMLDVDVIFRDENLQPFAHISADTADWDPHRGEWILTNGLRVDGLRPGELRSRELPCMEWPTSASPEEIALYRSNKFVELLSTDRINKLLGEPQSYGTVNLLMVKHTRVTQWLLNLVLVLLAVPCVLTREPGRLKRDMTRLVFIAGACMGTIFLCRQIAVHPAGTGVLNTQWPALLAWVPVFIFTPIAIYLLDKLHTKGS
jgi:lipopolysaccharide export system permease protein